MNSVTSNMVDRFQNKAFGFISEGQIILPDARLLRYCTYGTPDGNPVYFFHGFPGSRLQAALVADLARGCNICMVAFDKPGFGHSSHHHNRTIPGFADDISQLLMLFRKDPVKAVNTLSNC